MEPEPNTEVAYITTRQACDRLGYSRPDSFLRAWKKKRLPVYRRATGRIMVSVEDMRRFVLREPYRRG